ncbi:MAG: ImmA/IrrE family metallo-endopeptidase [Bacteroidales bacterium]
MKIQNKPFIEAHELRQSIGWINPSDFSLEIVAESLGISIKEVPIKGSEGRIIMNADTGIISINSSIVNQARKNFIIAHEIGHFLLHRDSLIFSDTYKTLSDWHNKGLKEKEANEFASELLLPSGLYNSKVVGKKLNLDLMKEVSIFFHVSILAAFIKYVTHGSYPVMIVFMENGIIKWKKCSDDFPFQYLPYSTKVPAYTVAGDYFYHNNLEPDPEIVDAIEWFPEDFQIKHKKDWKLWEQSYTVSEQGLVSCLWTL